MKVKATGNPEQEPEAKVSKSTTTTTTTMRATTMASASAPLVERPARADNFVRGQWEEARDSKPVSSPSTGIVVGQVSVSGAGEVARAVEAAHAALPSWRGMTVKARAAILLRFHRLMLDAQEDLARMVVEENGKNIAEARASVAKGAETVEWACGVPALWAGRCMPVSSGGIECREEREPIGVVACVVPFNFPAMVPMWTTPIALVAGNCVIVKPSEKVPFTLCMIAELMTQAGVPPGVFQLVQGEVEVVQALCDHPGLAALTFVGSSPVASIVTKRCHERGKRVLALGGAKNHLVALPDCSLNDSARDIVASFAGCAGQRCMAASVLICVGGVEKTLLPLVVENASQLQAGTSAGQVGAIIDVASQERILAYIDEAESTGAHIMLDGRAWAHNGNPGVWVGPTVILHSSASDRAVREEIFGPVLSVLAVRTWEEALAIEKSNPHGNAASIYTSSGYAAEYFSRQFYAGMIGVNIGVPVPREPFSFGGMVGTRSNYGNGDITGQAGMDFFTRMRKVTSRWYNPSSDDRGGVGAARAGAETADVGSFVGRM